MYEQVTKPKENKTLLTENMNARNSRKQNARHLINDNRARTQRKQKKGMGVKLINNYEERRSEDYTLTHGWEGIETTESQKTIE